MGTRGTCVLCGRTNLSLRGRGLCDRDYMREQRAGRLDNWPGRRPPKIVYPYCTCPDDTPYVRLFGLAFECRKCRRKVLGKDERVNA